VPSTAERAFSGMVTFMSSTAIVTELASRYDLDRPTAEILAAHNFDPEQFDELRGRLAANGADPTRNHVTGALEVPADNDLVTFPASGSNRYVELTKLGETAIGAGQVGVVLLAGGMATRFGGGVKALAEVLPGLRFVDVKIADLQNLGERLDVRIPMVLMSSYLSDGVLADVAEQLSTDRVAVETAPQNVAMRVTPSGDLFHAESGSVSVYSPGHGDLGDAIRNSGFLDRFLSAGGKYLFVTNVDNSAATLDPAMVGLHLDSGRPLTCEVVSSDAPGGAPYILDGHLQILEAFRVPPDSGLTSVPVVNTNSLTVDAEQLTNAHPLTWFEVSKSVDGVPVMQFERLVGELSAFMDTTMTLVVSGGVDGRFQPVKDPTELADRQSMIREILEYRGLL